MYNICTSLIYNIHMNLTYDYLKKKKKSLTYDYVGL